METLFDLHSALRDAGWETVPLDPAPIDALIGPFIKSMLGPEAVVSGSVIHGALLGLPFNDVDLFCSEKRGLEIIKAASERYTCVEITCDEGLGYANGTLTLRRFEIAAPTSVIDVILVDDVFPARFDLSVSRMAYDGTTIQAHGDAWKDATNRIADFWIEPEYVCGEGDLFERYDPAMSDKAVYLLAQSMFGRDFTRFIARLGKYFARGYTVKASGTIVPPHPVFAKLMSGRDEVILYKRVKLTT